MIDFNLIKPDGTGKFSPLLHKYVTSKKSRAFRSFQVFHVAEILDGQEEFADHWRPSNIIIGDGSSEDGVGGRFLKSIIFGERGVLSERYHYTRSWNLREITDEFWAEYLKSGRCAWDIAHRLHMRNDENRWHYFAGGRQRECVWCHRVFEMAEKPAPRIVFDEPKDRWVEYRPTAQATLLHPMGSMGESV